MSIVEVVRHDHDSGYVHLVAEDRAWLAVPPYEMHDSVGTGMPVTDGRTVRIAGHDGQLAPFLRAWRDLYLARYWRDLDARVNEALDDLARPEVRLQAIVHDWGSEVCTGSNATPHLTTLEAMRRLHGFEGLRLEHAVRLLLAARPECHARLLAIQRTPVQRGIGSLSTMLWVVETLLAADCDRELVAAGLRAIALLDDTMVQGARQRILSVASLAREVPADKAAAG